MSSRLQQRLFLVMTGLFFMSQYIYAPFLTAYVGVLGGTLFMTGLVAGAYGLLQGLARLPLGLWSDRLFRRKPFILAGTLLAALSSFGMGLSSTPEQLLFYRSVSGLAAGTWALFVVFYGDLFPAEEAGRSMGLLTFAASSGQLGGNLIGGFLAEHWGWTAPFLAGLLPGTLGFFVAWAIIKEKPVAKAERPPAPSHQALLASALRWPIMEASLLAILTHFIFYATILGFTPVYAKELGLSKLSLGLLGTTGGVAYVVGTLIATRANTNGLAARWILAASFAVIAVFTALTPSFKTFPLLAVAFAGLGLCRGTTYPVFMSTVLRESDAGCGATVMGFFQAVYAMGMFGGPAAAGAVAQRWGLTAVFPFCAALALVGLIWMAFTLAGRKRWEGRRILQP